MDDEIDSRPIVMDIGSTGFKYGFGGEDSPLGVEPCIRGEMPEYHRPAEGRYFWLGSELTPEEPRHYLRYCFGYWAGKTLSRDLMEEIYPHVLYKVLRVIPEEHPLLLADAVGTSKKDREWIIELLFGAYGVPWLCIVPQPTLALYSTGRTTGFVLDSGCGATQFSPIYEGCALRSESSIIELGGYDATSYLARMLIEKKFDANLERCARYLVDKTVDNIKIENAYVAKDVREEKPELREVKDRCGNVVTIDSERFRCAEIFFDPSAGDKRFVEWKAEGTTEGIDKIAFDTIKKCDCELQRDLWSNFVVSGGNTLLPGFCERLETSIRGRSECPEDIHFVYPEDRVNSVWRGGSALAASETFGQMVVSKQYYEECGAANVARAFI